ncbi:MAG: hypothetical protein V4539_00995 [Bacteroidota bacterium]
MKKFIDVKVTLWNRYYFNEGADINKLTELVRENGIDEVIDDELGFNCSEILFDTMEEMTPDENGGNSTIEIYVDDNSVWNNEIIIDKTN